MHGKIILHTILTIVAIENFEINTENSLRSNNIKELPWDIKATSSRNPLKSISNITSHLSEFQESRNDDANSQFLLNPEESRCLADINETCSKLSYVKRSSCLHLPVYASFCPSNFQQLTDVYGMDLCYIIMENQMFPPRCPYLHPLPFYEIRYYLLKHFRDRNIWLNAFKNTTSGFAHFEWIEAGTGVYGKVMSERITNVNQTINKNCLIFQNGNVVRVSCNERYDTICMYSTDNLKRLGVSLCLQDGYEYCTLGDYNLSPPKCFCVRLNSTQPKKHLFCEKLAEPIYPHQTELLKKHFIDLKGKTCWTGLYKPNKSTGMCKWLSTGRDVSYTKWARPEACEFDHGALIFDISPFYGWSLARDGTLSCAICEFTIGLKECSLELRFLPLKNQIELTIHNILSISRVNRFGLYCFSDTNEGDFKKKISILNFHLSNNDTVTARLDTVENYPGYYWCEAFQYNTEDVISSNRILVINRKEHGHEFSLYVEVQLLSKIDPFATRFHLEICRQVSWKIEEDYKNVSVRPMRAYFDDHRYRMILLIHISTRNTFISAGKEYQILYNILKNIPNMKIIYFKNSELCLPDVTKTSDDDILEWPETRIGAATVPSNRLCLDDTNKMLPVIRHCEGDFLYGAKWGLPLGDCTKNDTYSEVTEELFDLTQQNSSATAITTDLVRITQKNLNKQPIDIHLISVILEDLTKVTDEEIDYNDFSSVINNVMNFNKLSMEEAQRLLNSTDKILSALDDFMENGEQLFIVSSKLIVYISVLEVGSVGGLALYNRNPDEHNFKSYDIIELYQNASFENLLNNETLETAILLPTNAVRYIRNTFPSSNQTPKLVIMIFYDDLLFTEQKDSEVNQQSKTKIISVSVPGFKDLLDSPIKTAFKMPKEYSNTKNCSHWNYGLDEFMVSIRGSWKTDTVSERTSNLLEVCEYFHMTHFGLLLQGIPREIYNETVLVILTAIGSALSLIGIIPIFITAIIFKTWRSRSGNIILINFCVAITIQIILLFSSDAIKENGTACIIIGAVLHYIILSEFCWMFVVAMLQYRRFVLVFKPQEDNIVKKCLLIGWGFPLLPVVIIISISTKNFVMNEQGLCTVKGYYYLFGYLVPIGLILCSNIFLFVMIIYSVSKQTTERCAQRSRNYKLEILLGLFLFFALGMTWIFGIIGAFGGGKVFTYLFCIVATLRGLVLFLFFIVGNKETRFMWKKRYVYYLTRKWRSLSSTPSANTTVVSTE